MSFWEVLKGLKRKHIWSLFKWFLKHPFFMIATAFATFQTYKYVENKFPKIHGKNNKANAFRHALWNVNIAKQCLRFSKDKNAVLKWVKTITDWHEDFSPNKPIERGMDLHNNSIGREVFKAHTNSEGNLEKVLIQHLDKAIKIVKVEDVNATKEMVYLED